MYKGYTQSLYFHYQETAQGKWKDGKFIAGIKYIFTQHKTSLKVIDTQWFL